MHFAHTSEILASVSDSMETDCQQAACLLDFLVFHPDPDDFDQVLKEFE